MQKNNKDLLFHIETEAQYDSLKPLLIYLRDSTAISFDIVVPSGTAGDMIINKEVYEGCAQVLQKNHFKVHRGVNSIILPDIILNTTYKVFLSAYIYPWHYQNIDAKYRLMFPYASYYFNKPQWTIKQFIHQDYLADGLLSHAVGTEQVTNVFTKTYIVPSLKLMDYRKKSNQRKTKPVLFFAPTYNELDFAVKFLQNIAEIKKKYTVIMRGHHRVDHMEDNKSVSLELYNAADKVYSLDEYPLTTPLGEADIVVSDNSAVIFDAIYCGVPVALFSKDPNSLHYKDINTAQFDLIKKGYILWTDDPQKIPYILEETLKKKLLEKQKNMRQELFPEKFKQPINRWMEVLSTYLKDDLPYEYSLAKRYWVGYINEVEKNNQNAHREIDHLNLKIIDYETRVYNEQNPGIRISLRRTVKACLSKIGLIRRNT